MSAYQAPPPSYPGHGYGPVQHQDALYGATPQQAIVRFFQRYADFKGHASRSEYWWVHLMFIIVAFPLNMLSQLAVSEDGSANVVGLLLNLLVLAVYAAVLVPWLAVVWRRFHDTGKSGLFYLLILIPFVGAIIVLVMLALPTKPHNRPDWGGAPVQK